MNFSAQVLRKWDTVLKSTEGFVPAESASVLLDFRVDPEPEEAGLPPVLASALAGALLQHGTIAGRWLNREPIPSGAISHRFTRNNPVRRLVDRLRGTVPQPVITTSSLANVCELLDTGWSVQQQALLVLAADSSSSPDSALQSLATEWDWTAFTFPPPALALVAPGNDGDYILIAAPDQPRLTPILDSILISFRNSGISVQS